MPLSYSVPVDAPEGIARTRPNPSVGLYVRVLERLGLAICGLELAPGTIMTIDDIEREYGASRSVVREVIRVLESMSLVRSRKRVGVAVLAPSEWNLYDPQVIRWRLASAGRVTQLRSLTELRSAIEPEAAHLAAIHSPLANASDLMGLAGQMWAAGGAGDLEQFLALDTRFHKLVLISSGNEMFGKLGSVVEEVLAGRTHHGLMPERPHEDALQLHVDVASAIQRGAPDAARAAMLSIMVRTKDEMSELWASPHSNAHFMETI
jgi:DNA-binding FadR family transcriptional regulator